MNSFFTHIFTSKKKTTKRKSISSGSVYEIEGKSIAYTIRKSSRSKNLRLTIDQESHIRVSAPLRATIHDIEFFLDNNKKWIIDRLQNLSRQFPRNADIVNTSLSHYRLHKKDAEMFIIPRVRELAMQYGFSPKLITIKKLKTKWGSCSSTGNLIFNYKVFFLPQELQEYIFFHELCHLKEMNHSATFWSLVAMHIPDYKECRKQLRTM